MIEQTTIGTTHIRSLIKCPSIMECGPNELSNQGRIRRNIHLHNINKNVDFTLVGDVRRIGARTGIFGGFGSFGGRGGGRDGFRSGAGDAGASLIVEDVLMTGHGAVCIMRMDGKVVVSAICGMRNRIGNKEQ